MFFEMNKYWQDFVFQQWFCGLSSVVRAHVKNAVCRQKHNFFSFVCESEHF